MSEVNKYRKEYNDLLKKEKSQEEFINSDLFKSMREESKTKLMDQYRMTLNKLNEHLSLIKHYRPREILEGFELVEYTTNDN